MGDFSACLEKAASVDTEKIHKDTVTSRRQRL